jgi:hypothetical protein
MKKKKLIKLGIATILYFIISVIVLVALKSDDIIIVFGIQTARLLNTVSIIVIALGVLVLVTAMMLTLFKKEKEKSVNVVDKDLLQVVEHEISDLNSIVSKKWQIQKRTIIQITSDLEDVIEYYKSMQKEINIADDYDISDTCEVLEKVIEAMLQYIRHIARVLRIMSKSDHNSVTRELDNTAIYVKELRDKAQDFIMSVLDYMKDDTATENALDNISSFREIVLNEVSLIDQYLNN